MPKRIFAAALLASITIAPQASFAVGPSFDIREHDAKVKESAPVEDAPETISNEEMGKMIEERNAPRGNRIKVTPVGNPDHAL